MRTRTVKRAALLAFVAGTIWALPASATPVRTLNVDSCLQSDVATMNEACIQTGAQTSTTLGESLLALQPVPEAGTLAMAGLGLSLLGIYRISRKWSSTRDRR
jgi:hypothetical protein